MINISSKNQSAMPDTPKGEYFKDLIKHRSKSILQVQKAMNVQTQKIQNHIENGRYQIRENVQPIMRKPSKTQYVTEQLKLKDMNQIKRNLEGKLNVLENNLHHLTQKTQTSSRGQLTHKQHQEFMRQLTKNNKQLQIQKLQRKKMQEKKNLQKEQQRKKNQQAIRQQRQRRKKQQIQQKLKKINQVKQKRQQQSDAQNRVLSSIMQTKPLYEKIEEKHIQFQAQSLEQKKRKLAEIRSLHKPITKQEIEQHQKKVEAIRQKKQQQRQQRRIDSSMDNKPKLDVYKSQWYKKVEEAKNDQISLKDPDQLNLEQAKQMRDKLKQYGDYVKTNFKPEIDPAKANELKGNSEVKLDIKPEQVRKMGLDNLKWSKEHINPDKINSTQMNTTNSNINLPPKPINYLDELKRKRLTSSSINDSQVLENIIKKSVDEESKTRKLLVHVNKLQETAKRKEQMAKNSNKPVDEELDELYMNAVKVKIALLN